ncbi:MAG: aminoacetone oxidase family FAD-binding enzyme [Peptococcaceae bacterium]|jgi:predicted Rossmann fold flavoprotein|nr:aminoacetone oxidase family FAD-binding enzyme [Peptococcaceae bacterium]
METVRRRVVVVGGGASGMMAALAAGRSGAEAVVIEKNPRVGKKLLGTGNGRCNLTNENAGAGFYHGAHPLFAEHALSLLDPAAVRELFRGIGLETKAERDGKVYPLCDQASAVLDVLMFAMEKQGVAVHCGERVTAVRWELEGSRRTFFVECASGGRYQGDCVILACGGKAAPGCDGQSYELASLLGHRVSELFPALAQLKLEGDFFPFLSGVRIEGAAAVLKDGEEARRERGDLLFTNYGVSGPPILQLSRKAGEILRENDTAVCELRLCLLDRWRPDEILSCLERRFQILGDWPISQCLVGFVNKRLGQVLLKLAGLFHRKGTVSQLRREDVERLGRLFWDWRIPARGLRGWTNAQVTAGGVLTEEISARSMESKLVEGLYFSGEMVDIDGDCGGYNLQWAWASGFLAGRSAAGRQDAAPTVP